MSYCRWSDDDYQSDIYCYQCEDGGYVICVAWQRHVSDMPKPVLADKNDDDAFIKHIFEMQDWLKQADTEKIGLPSDGQHFYFETYQETIDKLLQLREEGYHVPERALESLREELKGWEN